MKYEPATSMNYGIVIRLNRENQNLTLNELAKISGISSSQISKIERGYETVTDNVVGFLFDSLGYDFNIIKENEKNIQEVFNDFYESIVYLDSEQKTIEIMNTLNNFHRSGYVTVEKALCNIIYNLTYKKDLEKVEEELNSLDSVVNNLNPLLKQIYFDYCGVYCEEIGKIDKAFMYYNQAIKVANNRVIISMIYYHLGTSYRKNRQILKAYQVITKAKDLFLKLDNYTRSVMADLKLANIHNANGEYEEALVILYKCLKNYERMSLPADDVAVVYRNIIWIKILYEKYDEILELLTTIKEDVMNELEKTKGFRLYRVITLYETNHQQEAKELCKKEIKNYNEEDITDNFFMYYYFMDSTKANRLRYLHQIKMIIKKNGLYSNYRLLFKLLKKECTSEKQLQELNDLMYNYIFNSYED